MQSRLGLFAISAAVVFLSAVWAQEGPAFTPEEQAVSDQMGKLRSLPDDQWTKSVGQLAAQIHQMPNGPGKQRLISGLVNFATEGDAGQATLQTIADTMVDVITSLPAGARGSLYSSLAPLARYEHVTVKLDEPAYKEAMGKLVAEDAARMKANFTLTDLSGKQWTLADLKGKVVMVNFWATWCPPCRREMPDMQGLYERFGRKGLVVLAISDETMDKVKPFIADKKYSYPILLDQDREVHKRFAVEGIPKTFVYDRNGKLAAVAIDRRTNRQFLDMLKQAGLE